MCEYDLSKAVYINSKTKMCVICHKKDKDGNEHGEFWILRNNLKYGYGCPKCKREKLSKLKSMTKNDFIEKARKVHGNKYDYSKVEYKKTNEKICIICPEHGEFWQTPHNHLIGCGCSKCAGIEKYTTNDFIEKARKIHGDKYDYSKVEYKNNRTKVCIICPKHGEFWQTPKNHLKGQGCNKCAIEYKTSKRTSTIEQFIERAKEVHGDRYDYSEVEYKNSRTKICIICPEHGEFWQTPYEHLKGSGCPDCAGVKKVTTEQFIQKARKIHGNKYDYSKVNYINAHTKVCIICPKHGEFWQSPHDHLNTQGCNKCGIESRTRLKTYTAEHFIQKAKEVHSDKYDYSKVEYKKSDERVCIICPKHGEFWQIANSHLSGSGCPKCSVRESQGENEISLYISEILPNEQIIMRDSKILKGKELDIYLPYKHIAIEYDGLIWHSEKFKVERDYHLIKTNSCKEQNIKLIHIFEDEWIFRKDIVKSRLNSIFNIYNEKIFARKTEIKNVDSTTAMKFLEANHIQGKCKAKYHYGLYYNDELVSLMTFGKTRQMRKYNEDYDNTWELLRFCNKLNTIVVGGASKLLKHFIEEVHPTKIITYADKRWSTGDLYNKLGFTHIRDSKPNYFYVVGLNRENRFKYRKGELVKQGYDANKSEHEIMLERKIYRIYDCGTMVYEMKFKE